MSRVLYDVSMSSLYGANGAVRTGAVALSELVKSVRAVPVAPEVLPRLQTALQDADTDTSDLGALIKLDAGLASSILKLSNSAYYSRGTEIRSIEDAVSLIGYQETLRLVARCSYATVMKGTLDAYGISGEQLWEEAVLTALAMEQLARNVDAEISEAYIAGLLNGIGMVAINDYLQRFGRGEGLQAPAAFGERARWERELIGHDHGQVGAAVMRQWKFATPIIHAVEHQFEDGGAPDEPVLSCLLPLALAMSANIRGSTENEAGNGGAPEIDFDLVRAQRARLDLRTLMEVTEDVRTQWSKTRKFLV